MRAPSDVPNTISTATRRRQDALHLLALSGFALAQPLFDMLGRYAGFFAAHRTTPGDLAWLIAMLCLALPGVLVLLEVGLARLGERVRRGFHSVLVVLLGTLAVSSMLRPLEPSIALHLGASLGFGLLLAFCLRRFAPVRSFLSVCAVGVVLFPAWFAFFSPARYIARPGDWVAAEVGAESDQTVVLIVFDELPTRSLLNETYEIDAELYPNFARLAARSTWYRRATAAARMTNRSLPAILTGEGPAGRGRDPGTLSAHPDNLFTLLAGSHEVVGFEGLTRLCPLELCGGNLVFAGGGNALARRSLLLRDSLIVYLHLVVPASLAGHLPRIGADWRQFGNDPSRDVRRAMIEVRRIEDFVARIGSAREPALYFLHSKLPHRPWVFLPDGRVYGGDLRHLRPKGRWARRPPLAAQAYQRHLLQLGYTDRLLGSVLDQLERVGLLDRSLLIVTADHGASFEPGTHFRNLTDATLCDVLCVPFFVKAPGQMEPAISDVDARATDILPTIAQVVGVPLHWKVDGVSLLGRESPRRPRLRLKGFPAVTWRDIQAAVDRRWQTTMRGDEAGFIEPRYRRELVGERVDASLPLVSLPLRVDLDDEAAFRAVEADATHRVCHVQGTLYGELPWETELAVAVNGVVRAVTRPFQVRGRYRFSAVVPPSAFTEGANEVEILLVKGTTRPRFERIASEPRRDSR